MRSERARSTTRGVLPRLPSPAISPPFLGRIMTSIGTRLALLLLLPALLLAAPPAAAQDPAAGASQAEPAIPAAAQASDPDNCLLCHRFPGLARLDGDSGELRLFFVSERFHADGAGPHTSLACTGCHDRSSVEQVPHEDPAPVDCSQACHLTTESGSVIDFRHKRPERSLALSVHSPELLAELPFDIPLLREGQSSCLYCHDDPTYRMPALIDTFHRGVDPAVRCKTCHDNSLPVDIDGAIRHVGSRLGAQRPAREAARACALCHSNGAINEEIGSHDAVTSYLRSFHGKASALGAPNAPVCTDCHSSEAGDAHLMLASTDPASPTHEDNRGLTCLSLGCHDNAAPALSAAGVHMRMSEESQQFEYYVTAFFLVLTIGVMSLYFLLLVLELLNIVVRRESDEQLELVSLARAIQSDRKGRRALSRLTVHQRFQHWILVLAFLILVLTGLPMKFATVEWMPLLVTLLGGLEAARVLHRIAALVISAAFLYHLAYLLVLGWKDLKRRRREQPERGLLVHLAGVVWDWPMMIRPRDVKDFVLLFVWLFGLRERRPEQGKFHFSQKFEYWAVFWGMTMIGASGAMLWLEDLAAETFGGRALNFAYIIHSDEAFLALLYIAVVHFFAVIFSPAVFPLNLGSLTGDMPPTELAENHIGHLRAVAAQLGIEAPPAEHPRGFIEVLHQIGRRSYALLQAAAIGGFAFLSVTFLLHELSGGEQALEVDVAPLRLDASALTAADEADEVGAGGAVRNALERGPVAHFHAIPTWYEQDEGNSCTTAGCHSGLPHGERKEVRAFLNMHTTFVDCQTCHRDQDLHDAELTWLSNSDRSAREAPAVLRLAALLETSASAAQVGSFDDDLLALLTEAVTDSGSDPELKRWLVVLESSRRGGVRYDSVIDSMRSRIGRHGHGEYGTKIGMTAASGRRWTPTGPQQAAIDSLRGPDAADLRVDERKGLVTTAHERLKKPEVECSLCHTTDGGLLDFEGLGYAPARAAALRSNTIARQAQAVEAGETFFLPNVLGGAESPEAGASPEPEDSEEQP